MPFNKKKKKKKKSHKKTAVVHCIKESIATKVAMAEATVASVKELLVAVLILFTYRVPALFVGKFAC